MMIIVMQPALYENPDLFFFKNNYYYFCEVFIIIASPHYDTCIFSAIIITVDSMK